MFRNIIRGTITGLVAKGIISFGSLLIIPLMLKQLGNQQYGTWVTISSTVSLMSFMDLGIGSYLMNFIAKAGNDENRILKFINLAYIVQFIFIGLICIIFTSAFNYINWSKVLNIKTNSSEIFQTIFYTFICFFFSLITNTIYSIQRGFQRSDIANIWQLISSLTYLICIWLVLVYKPKLQLVALVTFGIPVLIAILNSLWFLGKKQLFYLKIKELNFNEARQFISNSAGFLYLQVAALIAFQTDALIVAHVLDFEEVSKYHIIARVFYIPTLILNVYLHTVWPAYAEASGKNKWSWIKNTFYRNILGSLLIVIPFIAIIFLLKKPLFSFWLQNRIAIPDSLILAFAIWAIIYNCLEIHLATVLNGLNLIKIQAISAVFMITANIGLSILLTHEFGVTGVVWGTILSTLFFSTIPLFFYINNILKNKLALVVPKQKVLPPKKINI